MVSVKKDVLLAVLIPIIYSVGVVSFFLAIPTQSQSLNNFISFFASLSTILMVVVVIVSNSLQRKEMENTRVLQTQPLPYVMPSEGSHIEKMQFWVSYPYKEALLDWRVEFNFSLENTGNGPAVAVDIHPEIMYWDNQRKTHSATVAWQRIGLLKENEQKKLDTIFNAKKGEPSIAECIMKASLSNWLPYAKIKLTILYKNFLGASFKQTAFFDVYLYEDDAEKVKNCLKLYETAQIDYGRDIERANNILLGSSLKGLELICDKINNELDKNEDCVKLDLAINAEYESFSIRQISEKEYKKTLESAVFTRVVLPPTRDEKRKPE